MPKESFVKVGHKKATNGWSIKCFLIIKEDKLLSGSNSNETSIYPNMGQASKQNIRLICQEQGPTSL